MRKIGTAFIIIIVAVNLSAGTLLINEVAPGTSGDDWVELFFLGECGERIDISRLYVTMYYGTNEPLSEDPITLHGCDLPETPYDDRFAVVHLTAPGIPDETDLTGDTNRNGVLDIYCNNYPSSLWNTDCVVAIDTDDDPKNGGIIDFVAFSNRDESPNSTMLQYLEYARAAGQWEPFSGENPQFSMVDIGLRGLASHQSIARIGTEDRNTKEDFAVTAFQTPGRPNIISAVGRGGDLINIPRKKITVVPGHPFHGECTIPLTVFHPVSLRLRVFTPGGMMVHESPLQRNIPPGNRSLSWDLRGRGRTAGTGLYLAMIEAASPSLRRSQRETVYLIVSRYR